MRVSSEHVRRFKFGGKHQAKITQAIVSRENLSYNEMQKNFSSWDDAEKAMALYVNETDEDNNRKNLRSDGYPQYTTIYIPYSQAIVLSALTYYTSVFLGRNPVLQYEGRHGEGENQVQAIESLGAYQISTGENMVPLYIWFADTAKYNLGIVGLYWEHEKVSVTETVEEKPKFFGVPLDFADAQTVTRTSFVDGYMGNKIYNIKPHHFRPDPRVPMNMFQDGEFCGRVGHMSWNELLAGEAKGEYFNIDAVKDYARAKSMGDTAEIDIRASGSNEALELPDYTLTADDNQVPDLGRIPFIDMTVALQPQAWGLSSNTAVEKWKCIVAYGKILIHVAPLGFYHNKYPYALMQEDIEGYGARVTPQIERLSGFNDALSWLFNAHFYNVRKTLNDSFVVDPSKVVMADVINPAPGRVIRLKPVAYGQSIDSALKQLQNIDITRSHISDSQIILDMMNRSSGVMDNLMGAVTQGRKTATEVRASATSSVNRLGMNAEYMSHMGFGPLAALIVQQTQQMYKADKKFKLAGDTLPVSEAERFINIRPDDIAGYYDFMHIDGSSPRDKYALGSLMLNLMTQLQQMQFSQMLSTRYDFGNMFAFIAKFMGWRNIDRFKIQVQPDEELQRQAALGNMVAGGGGNAGGNAGSRTATGGGGAELTPREGPVNGSAQTQGLGPAG